MAIFEIEVSNYDLCKYLIKHAILGNGLFTEEDVCINGQNSQFLIICYCFEVVCQELIQAKHFVVFQCPGSVNFKFVDSNEEKFLPFIFLFESVEVVFLRLRFFLLLAQ